MNRRDPAHTGGYPGGLGAHGIAVGAPSFQSGNRAIRQFGNLGFQVARLPSCLIAFDDVLAPWRLGVSDWGQLFRDDGKEEHQAGAGGLGILGPDQAMMRVQDALGDGQAQSPVVLV